MGHSLADTFMGAFPAFTVYRGIRWLLFYLGLPLAVFMRAGPGIEKWDLPVYV